MAELNRDQLHRSTLHLKTTTTGLSALHLKVIIPENISLNEPISLYLPAVSHLCLRHDIFRLLTLSAPQQPTGRPAAASTATLMGWLVQTSEGHKTQQGVLDIKGQLFREDLMKKRKPWHDKKTKISARNIKIGKYKYYES